MSRLSNEFLVGLLALFVVAATVWGVLRTDDRPGDVGESYELFANFATAEGIYKDTPVRIAGVPVGNVEEVELVDGTARVRLSVLGNVRLSADSYAEMKGEGMLGDKFIRVTPGTSPVTLEPGGTLNTRVGGADLDAVTNQVSAIADDVKAITAAVRVVAEDDGTKEDLAATIENIRMLSEDLRAIAGENRQDLAIIADNLRQVSASLATVIDKTGTSVDQEMEAVRKATETLDRAVQNLESITVKIDQGEGTIGRLINDPSTIDSVNATLESVNDTVETVGSLVGTVSRIRTEVYYRGDYFYGSTPDDDAFEANPVAGLARNVVGIRLMPREDYWYVAELVSHPLGSISYEDHRVPELGTAYREYVTRPDYRFTFQFAKRFRDLVLRFGVKESSGGIGADLLLWRDRVQLSADVYDFTYGSWPVMNGIPNVQLTARVYPWRHLYFEGGLDNVVLGARYGYVTGFAGGGFTFDDDDLKYVLAALPISP
ncbi:MAG: MlaD family protein [Pseudomonadota bacterium]|nr:MlaD family protein [Pseudomonadota bacterium]